LNEISIENVGPIEGLNIPVPAGGGIVVLRGRNGSGKTTALESTDRLLGNKGARLEPTDGARKGSVDGLGARLTVGRSVRRTGELEVQALAGVDPMAFVDPGLKDADAADQRRLQHLCGLAGLTGLPAAFEEVAQTCGLDDLRTAQLPDDPVAAAGFLRREAQAKARAVEEEAQRRRTAAQGALDALGGAEHDVEDLPDLDGPLERLAARLQELKGHREQRQRTGDRLQMLDRKIAETRAQLQAYEAEREEVAGSLPPAEDPAEEERILAEREDLLVRRSEQRAAQEAHTKAKAARGELEVCEGLEAEAAEQRQRADGFHKALFEELREVLPANLRVRGACIQAKKEGRGWVEFAELSFGERVRMAMEIAVRTCPENALFTVQQEAWEGLDPTNRSELNALACEYGVVLLTAEAAEGDLVAQEFQDAD